MYSKYPHSRRLQGVHWMQNEKQGEDVDNEEASESKSNTGVCQAVQNLVPCFM